MEFVTGRFCVAFGRQETRAMVDLERHPQFQARNIVHLILFQARNIVHFTRDSETVTNRKVEQYIGVELCPRCKFGSVTDPTSQFCSTES